MCKSIIISIIFNLSNFISTSYMVVESNYIKSLLERNNVVNKGLWVRNKAEIRNPGDFIFRANSLDVDSVLQNNFDAFGDNNVQNSPFLTSYVERNKRSPLTRGKQHSRESNNRCINKSQCLSTDEQTASIVKSKFISTLKPGSIFVHYPYAVAALITDKEKDENYSKQDNTEVIKDIKNINEIAEILSPDVIKSNKEKAISFDKDTETITDIPTTTSFMKRDINNTVIRPRHYYETGLVKDNKLDEVNDTILRKKDVFRNVFDKEDIVWQNSAPISNTNVYKVLPKNSENKNKPITERGLIKVLSMLTKTFKKIMKQHNDIKRIHNRLYNLNDDFVKNIEVLQNKFEDFNSKYTQMIKVDQAIKQIETKLKNKEQNFLAKEKEMAKNLMEFENQQKKFLAQQKQFYNVQKLMLAQNEKINLKQDLIVKTQSEISHRQNNFARILKKAKQIYIDTKHFNPNKLNTAIPKPKTNITKEIQPEEDITLASISTTESVKINLFSIPTTSGIKNQDQILLDEKDNHEIDDLIYKYYFNNTFIDEIMKKKILSSFLASDNTGNNKKSKRNESKLSSTILLPVNKLRNDIDIKNNNRKRRWIKHSKKNSNKKNKNTTLMPKTNIKENIVDTGNTVPINFSKIDLKNAKDDPFMTMALSFCKEIGQDINLQSLNWCVEKALRRLQVVDFKMGLVMPPLKQNQGPKIKNILQNKTSVTLSPLESSSAVKLENPLSSVTTEPTPVMFFPDNDELESKLKEYEMHPDTEGTVYYDGSLHSSDLGRIVKGDSEGFSDIMPGLDSDSRVQVDPLALDLQAQRRADVRKINERIMKLRLG